MERIFYLFVLFIFFFSAGALSAQGSFESTPLPILDINTYDQEIPDNYKLFGRLRIVDNGPGKLNSPKGPFTAYRGYIGIELRGKTSQQFSLKKPYGFELRNISGAAVEAQLLGMPKESDWILLAPFSDKTLLRDALAFDLARRFTAMPYVPRTRYVELVINGDYRGVYILTERIKRDDRRVDIAKQDPKDPSGGFIIKIDKSDDIPNEYWFSHIQIPGSSRYTRFIYHYPKPEDITAPQQAYIQKFMRDFEDALRGPDFTDPLKGYQKYIDRNTFIDYMLFTEVTRNVDGYRLSTYFYKNRDSASDPRLKAGPVWDYNIAFGNANYCDGEKNTGWAWDYNRVCSPALPFWWERLRQDERYLILTQQRWSELRKSTLSDAAVMRSLDSLNNLIKSGPATRNWQRWIGMGEWQWPNFYVGANREQEIAYLRQWMLGRLKWMDGAVASLYTAPQPKVAAPSHVQVYPNPLSPGEALNFNLFMDADDEVSLRLIDAMGRTVALNPSLEAPFGRFEYAWDLPRLQSGMYLYEVRSALKNAPLKTGKILVR